MIPTRAFAALGAREPLQPYRFDRREPGPHDVVLELTHCGVCHSDIHQARDEWGGATFPMVPGHEAVGRVTRVGSAVTRFAVGDLAGVGCMVDSCGECAHCAAGLEQYCDAHTSFTYNSTEQDGKTPTQGGYASHLVVSERFALKLGSKLPLERVAPLLCAGITMYSPLKHWKVGAGHRVAVAGLGGLGHMAVQLAASMGAEVTLLSTSESKRDDAEKLGARDFVLTREPKALGPLAERFDFVLDTTAGAHGLAQYVKLLRTDGTLILVGLPEQPLSLPAMPLISKRRRVAGSMIGGVAETQEMLDYCDARGLGAWVETIAAQEVNAAWERVLASKVRYRFVLDLGTLGRE